MVNQISQSTVSQGTQGLFCSPALANQDFLIKQLVNVRNKSVSKICGQNVSCSNEQFFSEMSNFLWTVPQQTQHSTNHVL